MASSADDTFRRASQNAAARWKEPKNRSQALKEQIMDSFRLTKRIQEHVRTGFYGPVRQAWKDAFQDAGCQSDFDFDDEGQI